MAFSLIIGGTGSGKSVYAEQVVERASARPVYLATAQALDFEMQEKIARHQARRPALWKTIEEPFTPEKVISSLGPGQALLMDCVTLWLSNLTLAGKEAEATLTDFIAILSHICEKADVFVVTNELGGGVISADPLVRAFQDLHGRANQRLAVHAQNVILVTAGIPTAIKGALP